MIFISRREPHGPGRFLEWKVRLFVVGAALFLAAIGLHRDVLVLGAIGALAAAFLLRFFEHDEEEPEMDDDEAEDEEAPADEP